jgi:hypothetical protein
VIVAASNVTTALIGVGGVALGVAAKFAADEVTYVRGRRRRLLVATLKCLDRLEKLRKLDNRLVEAHGGDYTYDKLGQDEKKAVDDELWLLGPDLDEYLAALAEAKPRDFNRHFRLYGEIKPVLSSRKLAVLRDRAIIRRLGESVGVELDDEIAK